MTEVAKLDKSRLLFSNVKVKQGNFQKDWFSCISCLCWNKVIKYWT